jgi:hypothetical protein
MDTNLGCDSFKKRFRYLQYDVQYCPKPRIACIRHTEPSLRYRVPKVRCGMGNKTNSLSPCLPLSRVYVTASIFPFNEPPSECSAQEPGTDSVFALRLSSIAIIRGLSRTPSKPIKFRASPAANSLPNSADERCIRFGASHYLTIKDAETKL